MPIGALILAAERGDIEKVKRLLSIGDTRDRADEWDNSALRRAAENGHTDVVKLLLALKVVRDHADAANNNALYCASRNGHAQIVEILLDVDVVRDKADRTDNYILRSAALAGHADVVKALLTVKEVRNHVGALNNCALSYAAQKGHVEVVKILLNVEAVRNQAHIKYNESLRYAAENGHAAVVKLLLTVDEVRQQATLWDNDALRRAAEKGHLEIVKLLLGIETVRSKAAAVENYALRHAAKYGYTEIVKLLLNINTVQDNIQVNNNEALRWAAQNGHVDVVKRILLIEPTILSLNERTIFDIFSQEIKNSLELANLLMHALGRPSISNFPERNQEASFRCIRTHLARTSLENNPYGIAKSILEAYQQYVAIKQQEAGNFIEFQGNEESSMDEDLLKRVNFYFTEKIHPSLQNQYETLGNDSLTRLEVAELKIRTLILKKIKQTADIDKDETIIQFIESHQDNMLYDKELMSEARQLFSSKTIASHIAWRCYDKEEENPKWDNFFVHPKAEGANTSIFTTHAAWDHALTLREASDIVRERAAYYYLLVESEPNLERKQAMEDDFILYLAEIRRAHSLNSIAIDNPSCFPGTLTRLACIAHKSSLFKCAIEKQAVLESLMIEEIEKAFRRILNENKVLDAFKRLFPEADSPQALCAEISDAITGISYSNARDIIVNEAKTTLGYNISVYTPTHVKAREMFRNSIIDANNSQESLNQLIVGMEKKLQQTNLDWFITPVDRAYILFFIASLSPPSVASRLASLYSRTFFEAEKSDNTQKLNRFEIKMAYLKKHFLSDSQCKSNAQLVKHCKKLEEQQLLFEKIKETELNKSYSTDEIIEAIEELTAIPLDLRLSVLTIWQAKLKSEAIHASPCFFSTANKRHHDGGAAITLDSPGKEKENLISYLDGIKDSVLIRDNLNIITNIINDHQMNYHRQVEI